MINDNTIRSVDKYKGTNRYAFDSTNGYTAFFIKQWLLIIKMMLYTTLFGFHETLALAVMLQNES